MKFVIVLTSARFLVLVDQPARFCVCFFISEVFANAPFFISAEVAGALEAR